MDWIYNTNRETAYKRFETDWSLAVPTAFSQYIPSDLVLV
jgi:hypothetical protein